ncbi:MotA/TolQ/ExbB proton channel family protein [Rubinisphaera margarita]|uniref:MotA/TolQ/ExbB proton channel family protein n=1 Tax=Rubinisphaera margarita TaxID=2909586 RepID=UPI001EE7A4C3|nr:MotA/TolQ/ExbB proton channel family protein [Rubinisphaera margarita]MCG6156241.1 MotA/TolQ/ExbB proton channel family protein [Rubinisphaera margarita]
MTSHQEAHLRNPESKPLLVQKIGRSPLLWGTVACVLFYVALPVLPVQQALLIRYCCSHPLEYVTVAMFFIGMATLVFRALDLKAESHALSECRELLAARRTIRNSGSMLAESILDSLTTVKKEIVNSIAGRRLWEAAALVQETGSHEQLDSQMRHAAELELDRAQQKLGLVNTISWAIPIVGFLGTVMGITIAIANVTPDQLDQSLGEVTSGLGVAFDTTALSLTLSLVMVFSSYLVRSRQDDLLNRVEEDIDRQLARRFHSLGPAGGFAEDQTSVSRQLVEASQMVVEEATAAWRSTLSTMQDQVLASLQDQQSEFLLQMTEGITSHVAAQQSELQEQRVRDVAHHEAVLLQLQATLEGWTESMKSVGSGLRDQAAEQQTQTLLLEKVVDKQRQLALLQEKLDASLNSQQIVETLDQTLISLTAAIQLLNGRVHSATRAA